MTTTTTTTTTTNLTSSITTQLHSPEKAWKIDFDDPGKYWKTGKKGSWKVMENYFQCSVCTTYNINVINIIKKFNRRHHPILEMQTSDGCSDNAVQATSALITDPSAGRPTVAVCNCWRPNLRHCWCSVVEQLASIHCCVWLTSSVPPRT